MPKQTTVYQLFSINNLGYKNLISQDQDYQKIKLSLAEYSNNNKTLQIFKTDRLQIEQVTTKLISTLNV